MDPCDVDETIVQSREGIDDHARSRVLSVKKHDKNRVNVWFVRVSVLLTVYFNGV